MASTELGCNHYFSDGKSSLSEEFDGYVECALCGKKWKPSK